MTLPYEKNIKCSNYVGETIDMAVDMGVKGILFVAHIGKFVKLASGIMNTHSHSADARMETIASNAIRAGAPLACAKKILEGTTTDEALDILSEYGFWKRLWKRFCPVSNIILIIDLILGFFLGQLCLTISMAILGRQRMRGNLLNGLTKKNNYYTEGDILLWYIL